MSPEELRARARRLPEELLTQGDLAVADEIIAPACAHHAPTPLAPGVAGMKRWVLALRHAFPDLCTIVEDEIAEGDTAVQRITACGTHSAEFLGLPPTGRRVTFEVVAINRFGPDGKIDEHWSVVDMLTLLQQLGTLPAPDRTGP